MTADAARGLRTVAKLTGGRFAAQVVLVVTAVVLPRLLGAESYGFYAAWMAVVAIGGGVAALGLPMVEARYLAPLWSLGRREEALALGSSIWFGKLALGAIAAVGVAAWLLGSPQLGVDSAFIAVLALFAFALFSSEAATSLYLPFDRSGTLSLFVIARAALALPVVAIGFAVAGLDGVAIGLALLYSALFAATAWLLQRIAPLSLRAASWSTLRPFTGFALAAFVANLAWRFQGQFAVYAIAAWSAPAQAGFLALALQPYNFLQLLVLSARRALTPTLADLYTRGEMQRVVDWTEVSMRCVAAAVTCVVMGWALVGRDLLVLLLGDDFLPVHATATLILLSALLYGCAECCNMVLYLQGHARDAAGAMIVYAVATVAGSLVAIQGGEAGTAERTALAYLVAAAVFFSFSFVNLCLRGVRLSLVPTTLVGAPVLVGAMLAGWQSPLPTRAVTLGLLLTAYVAAGHRLGLLPLAEARAVLARRPATVGERP